MPEPVSIQVGGNVEGSIVVGDHNFVVNTNHGTIVYQQTGPQVRARQLAPQPPRAPRGFVNRTTELTQLETWIAANEIVLLHAPDGMGKSALLKQAANSAAARAMPGGVILLESLDVNGQALGPDDIIQRLFDALFESNPPLKVDAVSARTYLSNTRPLVLMDEVGLSPALQKALPDLFPQGAILLSADAPLGADFLRLPVKPLPRAESVALLAAKAELTLDDTNRATIDKLCALLDDVSLALVITANVLRETQTTPEAALQAIGQIPALERDPVLAALNRAFGFAFSRLSPEEQKVLSAAALTPGVSMTPEWLSAALGGVDVDTFIERLKALGLLFANSPRLRLPPGFHAPARRAAVLDENVLFPRLIEFLSAQLDIEAELGNFLGALTWATQAGRPADVIALGRALDPYLTLHGLWDAWNAAIGHILEAARQSGERAAEAWALHQSGVRAIGMGARQQALDLLRQALELRRSLGDTVGMAYTQHNIDLLIGPPPPPHDTLKTKKPPKITKGGPNWPLLIGGIGVIGVMILAALVVVGGLLIFPPKTVTPEPTPSATLVLTPTLTRVRTPTLTQTPTPVFTATPTATFTPTATLYDDLPTFCYYHTCVRWFIGLGAGTDPSQLTVEQAVVDDFNAAPERSRDHIYIQMEVVSYAAAKDTILTEIAAGNGPDIVGPIGWSGSNLLHNQWLDLQDYIARTDTSVFNPALLSSYKTTEGQVALPFAVYPSAIFYNTAIFNQADLSYPPAKYGEKYFLNGEEVEWNWDTLRQVAMRLTLDAKGRNVTDEGFDRSQIVQYGFSWNYETEPSYLGTYWANGSYTASDGRTAQLPETWKAAWDWTYNGMWGNQPFIPNGKVSASADFGSGNVFNSGRVAMIDQPLWYLCCADNIKTWDLAAMPSYKETVNGRVDSDTFRILKSSRHPNEAFKFLNYLVTIGVQKLLIGNANSPAAYTNALPAHAKYQQLWLDIKQKQFPWVQNWQVLLDGQNYPDVPSAEAYMTNYDSAWARGDAFYKLLVSSSDIDIKREEAIFLADLQTIFDSSAP